MAGYLCRRDCPRSAGPTEALLISTAGTRLWMSDVQKAFRALRARAGILVTYLTEPELDALIDAPDRTSWTGRRDHASIILLARTGLRASELTGLVCGEIHLCAGAHATTTGKGRKQRITPLTQDTAAVLRAWLAERGSSPTEPLFPTSTGKPLTRKALAGSQSTQPTPQNAARR